MVSINTTSEGDLRGQAADGIIAGRPGRLRPQGAVPAGRAFPVTPSRAGHVGCSPT
ncbi:hypothetical protein [Actinoallomurus iriomotensis]|uniref:hypothetical protein n=1 Tax=Actinoallomurus iriomotensis TaxID=478107 RepID=UPI0025565318|nr:hypothetical protein [Actinoallomurus iriomotensis]